MPADLENARRVAICGWCATELPDSGDWMADAVEVQHHFLIAHNQPVSMSVSYVYPEDADRDLAALLLRIEDSRG